MMNYLNCPVRSALVPTATYVAGTVIKDAYQFNQCDILVAWVKGTADSCEVKVEFSNDGSTYYRETNATASGGTTTLTINEYTFVDGGNYRIQVPISAQYIKISVKATGTLTTSTVAVDAILHTT